MPSYPQRQSNHDFQNPYFGFMYVIKTPETKKRYPDRFKAFLDYEEIPGTTTEERLLRFYEQAKQNPQWQLGFLMRFILFQKESVEEGKLASSTISQLLQTHKAFL